MSGHIWQWDGWCSLKIPDVWNVDEDEGIISITRPDGVGALQISFASREKSVPPTPDEAILLAKTVTDSPNWKNANIQSLIHGAGPAAFIEYRETDANEDSYWCFWCLLDARRAAFITYTSAWVDRQIEKSAYEYIVTSFRWIENADYHGERIRKRSVRSRLPRKCLRR
jgi:hypothetical protein